MKFSQNIGRCKHYSAAYKKTKEMVRGYKTDRDDAVEMRLTFIWQVNCSSTDVRFEEQVLTLECYAV
jgi:hypothetical protein